MKYNFYPFNFKGFVKQEDNKAIIQTERGHYCGYVCFPSSEIPKEWHGFYDADALQYLSIHGGITFCQCETTDKKQEKQLSEEYENKIKNIQEWHLKMEIEKEKNQKIAELPNSYVVFGFDCGHAGDEDDPNLRDPEYVMNLTKIMENQIKLYASKIQEWRSANREKKLEIVDTIRKTAQIQSDIGFGGLISMMGGASEFGENNS